MPFALNGLRFPRKMDMFDSVIFAPVKLTEINAKAPYAIKLWQPSEDGQ
jgi:hypothetical protein